MSSLLRHSPSARKFGMTMSDAATETAGRSGRIRVMIADDRTRALGDRAFLFEEFLVAEHEAGHLKLDLRPLENPRALVHGHCHQKAFGVLSTVERVLSWIPNLEVGTIESSCCGMAGSFGYEAEHYDTSLKMAEMDVLPAVRDSGDDTVIVADGTSCRCQIRDGTGREGLHAARVLDLALE